MNKKGTVVYKISNFTFILPSGKEAEGFGCVFSAKDNKDALVKFEAWSKNMINRGTFFGSKQPKLSRIEATPAGLKTTRLA